MISIDNRIKQLFREKKGNILNIYCTAGYPALNDTPAILEYLQEAGVDMVEIGMPFSDPIADGNTIQHSNQLALQHGMNIALLFEQLKDIRTKVHIPLILMGYINPVLQYGIDRFCKDAADIGIDGLILPDLPMWEFEQYYQALFQRHGLALTFLITPQTSEERIRKLDGLSDGFLYLVSSDSTTGKTADFIPKQINYFKRVSAMKLTNPLMVGFGISSHQHYRTVTSVVDGAIIGSAFIKAIKDCEVLSDCINTFVRNIRGNTHTSS